MTVLRLLSFAAATTAAAVVVAVCGGRVLSVRGRGGHDMGRVGDSERRGGGGRGGGESGGTPSG